MIPDLEELYETNEDFKDYVDKASWKRHRPVKEILTLRMAMEVALYYTCIG